MAENKADTKVENAPEKKPETKPEVKKDAKAKKLKKYLGYVASPFTVGLCATLVITFFSFSYYKSYHLDETFRENSLFQIVKQIHEKTIDFRFKDRGQRPADTRVAVLAIDDKSVEQEGRWPWPREKMARLIERTIELGAKVVAFDIIFSEHDANSSLSTLRTLQQTLHEKQKLAPEVSDLLKTEMVRANSDEAFGRVIGKLEQNLVLGSYFDTRTAHTLKPHQDICSDVIYDTSYSSYYWEKEDFPLGSTDETNKRLKFPAPLKNRVADYLSLLEITAINSWFDENPTFRDKILKGVQALGESNPNPELFAYMVQFWLRGHPDKTREVIEQLYPELAKFVGPEDIKHEHLTKIADEIDSRLDLVLGQKEKALLWAKVRDESETYCGRFLTTEDELINEEKFRKYYADPNLDYKQYSLREIWPQIEADEKYPMYKGLSFEQAVDKIKSESYTNAIREVQRWWLNIPVLARNSKHTGYFNAFQDSDGSIRRSGLVVRYGNNYQPSMALKAFLLANNYRAKITLDKESLGSGLGQVKRIKDFSITNDEGTDVMKLPVDGAGQVHINYAGPQHSFPYVSAADILSEGDSMEISTRVFDKELKEWGIPTKPVVVNKKEFLKDKILIIGATAIGIYDLRVTPFEENYPGVETHANVLSNLLTEEAKTLGKPYEAGALSFMKIHPQEEHYMWVVLLGLGLILSGLLAYFGSITGLAVTATAMAAIYLVDKFLLFNSGWIVNVVFPTTQIGGVFVSMTFYKYFTEEKKKRELKGTFAKYVSPAIVDEVLADPGNIELGGRKMELTVFFSDVRGFTTISEKLDPRALSDLLNSYLTPMTDLVFANKGTLDKYMGDAVMAFFGAPIAYKDHAKYACRCALQSVEKLKELQAEYRAKGLPEIDLGIGLNTAEVSVGNMGSQTVRNYTVMGDGVNLASRLEGINKQYGTRIIISEFTKNAIGDDFLVREMDWVKVKGKKLPVKIFELVAEKNAPQQTLELLKFWNEGFQFYHDKAFDKAIQAFTQALNILPTDEASKLYLERCQDYLKEPPPEDWDGVFTMTTK